MNAPKPQPAADPLGSFFGGGGGGGGSTVDSAIVGSGGIPDLFGDMKSTPSKSSGGSAAMSSAIASKLSGLRRSPAQGAPDLTIGSSGALSVSYIKAFAAEKTIVALFFTNAGGAPVDADVKLDLANGLSISSFDGEPLPQSKGGNTFVVQKIGARQTAATVCRAFPYSVMMVWCGV